MARLVLLLTLGLGAAGGDPGGVAEPVAALEALLSSGSGSLPHGALESLVGIAGGRAQCRAGPCGKGLSAAAVLALAGKGEGAALEPPDLPWLGAAILVTLRDPPGACAAASGCWAPRARALLRAFAPPGPRPRGAGGPSGPSDTPGGPSGGTSGTSDTPGGPSDTPGGPSDTPGGPSGGTSGTSDTPGGPSDTPGGPSGGTSGTSDTPGGPSDGTSGPSGPSDTPGGPGGGTSGTSDPPSDTSDPSDPPSGGPSLREVAELLAAVEPNYRSDGGSGACVDAAGALAAGAAASPRVGGAGARVLAALGALVLRGRCLRAPPPGPPGLDYLVSRFGHRPALGGLSTLMEQLGLGPGGQHPPTPPGGTHGTPPPGNRDRPTLPHPHLRSQPWASVCLAPPELLGALGVPGGAPLMRGDFLRLGPTLLQQQLSGACAPHPTPPTTPTPPATPATPTQHHHGPTATGELSIAERFAAGSAAGLVLVLVPALALALLRCPPCRRGAQGLRPLLLGLAAGALSGDALLHLLPQCLGLHEHDVAPPGRQGAPHAGAGPKDAPWRLLTVLGGVFAFFLLERALGIALPPPGRQHTEANDPDLSQSPQELQGQGGRALPWMLTLGHGAHGLADGLALGAAFGTSWGSGVATGGALLCHELPHALGAAGVLLQAGLGGRRVLALGVAGALPLLPGLYLGLALGAAAPARPWLGAFGAGLLLYLALCDMVPAMLSARAARPWALLGLQSAGLLGGWGLLLLLALYEEEILR